MKTCTQRKLQSSSANLNGKGPAEGSDVNFVSKALFSKVLSDGPAAPKARRTQDRLLSVESRPNRALKAKTGGQSPEAGVWLCFLA